MSETEKPLVTHIEFAMVVGGKRRVVVFTRAEKIQALLDEQVSLGTFMREMRDAHVNVDPATWTDPP